MADYHYDVPRLRDRDLFRFFVDATRILNAGSFSVTESGARNASQVDVSDLGQPNSAYLAKSQLYSISRAEVNAPGFHLGLTRDATQSANYNFDRISISNNHNGGNSIPDEAVHSLNRLINESFHASSEQSVGLFHNSKTFTLLMQSHQQMLTSLQSTATSITEQLAAARLRLEEEFAERQSALELALQERQASADQITEEMRKHVLEREQDLELRRKDLDDRDNTTARRSLHSSLKTRIAARAQKFEITPETKRTRWPIHAAVVVACTAIAGMIYIYSPDPSVLISAPSTSNIVALSIKPALLSLAFLGLVTWYVRWMNRWFEMYATAEFHLKQFELDIDRASWVVETALEWKEVQDKPLPDPLLESLSRNLFSRTDKDESSDMHPADYLASAILGRASGVNLKVPGGEISLSGRDIRKLKSDEI